MKNSLKILLAILLFQIIIYPLFGQADTNILDNQLNYELVIFKGYNSDIMFAEREKFIKFHPDIESKIIYTSPLFELIVGSCEKKERYGDHGDEREFPA